MQGRAVEPEDARHGGRTLQVGYYCLGFATSAEYYFRIVKAMADSPQIILATINARYGHTAFGLRWLWANLGHLRDQTVIREFVLNQPPLEIAERLIEENPRIIGFGVYIWNVAQATQVLQALKAVRPEIMLVIGGPEASYEYEGTPLFAAADYLVRGEGEIAFARLAGAILAGVPPLDKVLSGEPPDLDALELPYEAYTEEDIARRTLYVEASRGCPFRCEFCLSSLDQRVREFPLTPFLGALGRLLERGARRFKFVDRTFNLHEKRMDTILTFLEEHWRDGMQVHFEIVPDRLSEAMLTRIKAFPAGGLRLEVGVQTFNPEAQKAISRRQDLEKTVTNLRVLRQETGAVLHADLIAGLPGEDWESFARGFDQLIALNPHEIQVGILKRLKGAPIARHVPTYAIAFSQPPPYEVLQTDRIAFQQMQRLKRFARYFDLYYNSGDFPESLPLLWAGGASPFDAFMALSDTLWAATGRTHEFALAFLARHLYGCLLETGADSPSRLATIVKADYHRRPGRTEKLDFSGFD